MRNRRLRRELADEVEAHLQERIDDLVESGMSGTAANRTARREFGNAAVYVQTSREAWGWMWADRLFQDIAFGLRLLKRDTRFTVIAVMALGLGIGANTAVFTIVNPALFKNLPFPESERIVYVSALDRASGRFDLVSYSDYLEFRDNAGSFEGMAAFSWSNGNVSDSSTYPQSYDATCMTSNGFAVLGQRPAIGRDFLREDAQPGATPVVIISDRLWAGRFGRDRAILGKPIRVNSVPTTVIGVMPAGFRFPTTEDLWMPLQMGAAQPDGRELVLFGRLGAHATLRSAKTEVSAIAQRLEAAHPETNRDRGALVYTFNEFFMGGKSRSIYFVLLGAVGFVLLIACTNVANLLLVRALGRSREISIRMAVGAGQWRVIRQLLVESTMLAVAGGAAGLLIAQYSVKLFDSSLRASMPNWWDFLDGQPCISVSGSRLDRRGNRFRPGAGHPPFEHRFGDRHQVGRPERRVRLSGRPLIRRTGDRGSGLFGHPAEWGGDDDSQPHQHLPSAVRVGRRQDSDRGY
ncbi:MAG TPA: ABC transporter permease [Bryobacteraceae bacterium]|nr:ABC transporter permease [Bryobacteraceae bacterium]